MGLLDQENQTLFVFFLSKL